MTTPPFLMIEIDIRGYWHPGTGRAGGEDTDAVIDRDEAGLPLLRGRHIKGLMRETAERMRDDWKVPGWNDATINLLFGREAWEADEKREAQLSAPGCIQFGNARLPAAVIARAKRDASVASRFVVRLASTRIDFETGAAKNKTLRSMEAAIPLKLEARLDWAPSGRRAIKPLPEGKERGEGEEAISALSSRWRTLMTECLPFVISVGAHRNRGFGRAVFSAGGLHHA